MEDKIPDFAHILEMQAIDEMKKEINDLKEEKKRREQNKKEEITLAQQLLLFHYSGLLYKIDLPTNTGKSALLSKMLNRNKDNIRKNITYINSSKISLSKIKNVENLELVLNIFESLSMDEVADKVKLDLKKIKEV